MDPNATLELFFDALDEHDFDAAEQHYTDLCAWLAKGGFEPDWADFIHGDDEDANIAGTPVTKEWFMGWSPDFEEDSDLTCPGCGCTPGEGITETCDHPEGCGYSKSVRG